jgi:hypothetical protein
VMLVMLIYLLGMMLMMMRMVFVEELYGVGLTEMCVSCECVVGVTEEQ